MIFHAFSDQPVLPVSHDKEIVKRVLLATGEVSHLAQLARSEIPPNGSTSPHVHRDMSEVFVVLQGVGEIFVDGKMVRVLQEGDCVVFEPGEEHVLRNPSREEGLRLLYFGTVPEKERQAIQKDELGSSDPTLAK